MDLKNARTDIFTKRILKIAPIVLAPLRPTPLLLEKILVELWLPLYRKLYQRMKRKFLIKENMEFRKQRFKGGTDQGTVPNTTPKRDLGRTFIGSPQQEDNDDNPGKVASAPRATRKIVGWVISYTLDEMGVDYRIYEGRNTIGCDPKTPFRLPRIQRFPENM